MTTNSADKKKKATFMYARNVCKYGYMNGRVQLGKLMHIYMHSMYLVCISAFYTARIVVSKANFPHNSKAYLL